MEGTRVLIVDDQCSSRDRLRLLLGREASLGEVREAASGREAREWIAQERPAVVFAATGMAGESGFEMLAKLPDPVPLPAVVFVTEPDPYLVPALEFHAVDYLLKPVMGEQLPAVFGRAVARWRDRKTDELRARNAAILADLRAGARRPERMPVRNNGRVFLVNLADIDWIGSADNYAELHVAAHSHLIRETLSSLAGRLPADWFCRVSRTAIVNRNRLKELQPLPHGEYLLTLTTGAKVMLSRTYREVLPALKVAAAR